MVGSLWGLHRDGAAPGDERTLDVWHDARAVWGALGRAICAVERAETALDKLIAIRMGRAGDGDLTRDDLRVILAGQGISTGGRSAADLRADFSALINAAK